MQEEFEKKIQERMHTFGIPPSPQVWEDIDAVLSKKKHRRVFIGWWILLGLLIAGAGTFLLEKDHVLHNTLEQPAITSDSTQKNIAGNQPENMSAGGQKATQNNQPAGVIAKNDLKAENGQIQASNDKQAYQIQKAKVIKQLNKSISKQSKSVIFKTMPGSQPPVVKQEANNHNPGKEPPLNIQGNNGQTIVPQPANPIIKLADEASSSIASSPPGQGKKNVTPKAMMSSRHQWFLRLSAGVLQTTKNSLLSNDKSLSAAGPVSYDNNILALTSPAALKYDLAAPGTGFIVSGGAVYQYKLSTRWQLYGGLGAAFLTNTQKVGNLYQSAFNLTTGLFNADQAGQVQTAYYLGGQENLNTIVNKAWQLQAQVGANFIITPRAKTKVFVDAGFSSAWMLASRWLIPDARYDKLYYNKQILNNTIISWQAGPGVQLKNEWKFGLEYQQSFTTLAKSYVTPHLKWENINVYTAIPFSFKSKKSKH
ncbi:MAG TPA: hypothetical protein VG738_03535 [Chitinophagaceae bacterium]|nr:hypothetical protein [Chitinophagaceae bacterium]